MHGCGHCNERRYDRNQLNKVTSYMINETEHFSYEGGCGIRILRQLKKCGHGL